MKYDLWIDADDTLWENNIFFERVFDQFLELLSHSTLSPLEVRTALDEIEHVNNRIHGYGAANFVRNLTQCYGKLCEQPLPDAAARIETYRDLLVHHPLELIEGAPARFGDPLLLELGGLGLRGMGSTADGYYLIAGPVDGLGESRIHFWKGPGTSPEPMPQVKLPDINPEAICFHDFDGARQFLVLSDDGSRNLNGKDCKDLPPSDRRFRAYWIPR